MASDAVTIARPYAEAVYQRAQESSRLDTWGEMLAFLAAVVADDAARDFLSNPSVEQPRKVEFLLQVAGDRLDEEGRNLVKLLVSNGRVLLLPEIERLFQLMRNEQTGQLEVEVASAYVLEPEVEQKLVETLERKLGRKVNLHTKQDESLIGGVRIRAGDMVIDGSVAGQLSRLANELGIQG